MLSVALDHVHIANFSNSGHLYSGTVSYFHHPSTTTLSPHALNQCFLQYYS